MPLDSDLNVPALKDLSFDDPELTEGPTLRVLALIGFQKLEAKLDQIAKNILIDKIETPEINFRTVDPICIYVGTQLMLVLNLIEDVVLCETGMFDDLKEKLEKCEDSPFKDYRENLTVDDRFSTPDLTVRKTLKSEFKELLSSPLNNPEDKGQCLLKIQTLRLKVILLFFSETCRSGSTSAP
jgi:hypothetical protein